MTGVKACLFRINGARVGRSFRLVELWSSYQGNSHGVLGPYTDLFFILLFTTHGLSETVLPAHGNAGQQLVQGQGSNTGRLARGCCFVTSYCCILLP